jgi:hypothetical protein
MHVGALRTRANRHFEEQNERDAPILIENHDMWRVGLSIRTNHGKVKDSDET